MGDIPTQASSNDLKEETTSSFSPGTERTRHSAGLAAVLSAIVWGFGQWYNRQYIKGSILFLCQALFAYYLLPRLPRAVWGIVTLGEVGIQKVKVNGRTKTIIGDHSIHLLISGLIVCIVFVLFIWMYVSVIRDAYRVAIGIRAGKHANSFKKTIHHILEHNFAQVLLTVPVLGVLFFTIMPILFMILLAFTNYSAPDNIPPAKLVDWVGFQNFIDLVKLKTWSGTFFGVLTWTIIWAVIATFSCYIGGILVALLIQQAGIRFKTMWRTIFIIPYAIPQIVSFLIMRNMFNGEFGPINQYLSYFGLGKVPWLSDPIWAKATVLLVNMWVGIPVSMVLITGVLTTIPRDWYEAAEVDGATAWHKFRNITMPMILYSTAPVLIMQFSGNINNFNVIFLMTNGNPVNGEYQYAGSTDLLVTWLYKLTLDNSKFSIAATIGIILFVIVASFSIWNYRRSRSFREEDMIQ